MAGLLWLPVDVEPKNTSVVMGVVFLGMGHPNRVPVVMCVVSSHQTHHLLEFYVTSQAMPVGRNIKRHFPGLQP